MATTTTTRRHTARAWRRRRRCPGGQAKDGADDACAARAAAEPPREECLGDAIVGAAHATQLAAVAARLVAERVGEGDGGGHAWLARGVSCAGGAVAHVQ